MWSLQKVQATEGNSFQQISNIIQPNLDNRLYNRDIIAQWIDCAIPVQTSVTN